MHKLIAEIDNRLYLAIRGQRNAEMWDYPDDCGSAPDGMDYTDWIDESMQNTSRKIDALVIACEELKSDLLDRAEIDGKTKIVDVSWSRWESFKRALDSITQ